MTSNRFIKGVESIGTKITIYAFKQRFTQAERITIREAAKVIPEIEDFQDLLDSATYVDFALADGVAAMLPQLESASLLSGGRAEEIVNAPVKEHERWNG